MLRISYKDKVTNAKVFETMRMTNRMLFEDIVEQKGEYVVQSVKKQ